MSTKSVWFNALHEKATSVTTQAEKMFGLAYHYYLNNGRGAVLMNFLNLEQLNSVDDATVLQYLPFEIAAEFEKGEILHLIQAYNPQHQFVVLLCVASPTHSQNDDIVDSNETPYTTLHIHATIIDKDVDVTSGTRMLAPVFLTRSNSRVRFNNPADVTQLPVIAGHL